jgi:hypothetical protein
VRTFEGFGVRTLEVWRPEMMQEKRTVPNGGRK